MTPEQERVSSILLDTVALLCKNSLSFTTELKVQGLIGITMDGSDIFLIQINELFHPEATESVKQERVEVGVHHTPKPSQTFNERRAPPKTQPERKPVSRPLYSQSNRSNQMAEGVEAYHLNQNIKSEVGYDDPTSTFGEFGYAENTVMSPPSSKVKPITMMRQTQVTYGSGASSSTVASTIVTEAFKMLDEEEEEEEEAEGFGSQGDHLEQGDEMTWDPTSGDGLYQHHLDQSQLDPPAPAAQMMWAGAMSTPRSSGFGFSHKVKTIESQKEKEHIIIDGFRYRKDRVNIDGSASWRCARRACKGRIRVTTDDASTLISDHCHASGLEHYRLPKTYVAEIPPKSNDGMQCEVGERQS